MWSLGTTCTREVKLLYFGREICFITDHIPLAAILRKDMGSLSQWLQHTLLSTHQFSVHTIYKPDQELYIADWLSYNKFAENKDQEITGMNTNVSGISIPVNIPIWTSIHREHIGSNTWRCSFAEAEITHDTGLAKKKRRLRTWLRVLLARRGKR